VARLLNLLSQDRWVLTGVTNVHVSVVTEPWHVNGEELGGRAGRHGILRKHVMGTERGASTRHHEQSYGET